MPKTDVNAAMAEFAGCTVRDRVTGLTGVVTGIVFYISGCHQALVAPKVQPDDKIPDSHWLDLQRLEILGEHQRVVLDNGETPGCDRAPPKR